MLKILIKEVCDVTFYKIAEGGNPGVPVLYLDTLKVSTTEQTAESTSARGGKGNPELEISSFIGRPMNVKILNCWDIYHLVPLIDNQQPSK